MGLSPDSLRLPTTKALFRPAALLAGVIVGLSAYVNLSFVITDPANYRFFPPFQPGASKNNNRALGDEYLNIARSITAGEGFSHPFGEPTGPTAWMPPVLSLLEAGLLWACGGEQDAVMAVVIALQDLTLIGTGVLVLALGWKTAGRPRLWLAFGAFLVGLACSFYRCFMTLHDSWLALAVVDVLVGWGGWGRPLRSRGTAVAWGLFGGFGTLVSPALGPVWLVLSLAAGYRGRAQARLAAAVLAAGLALSPWMVRNYLVFGGFVPIKSNLAYELYQSQCLQPDGVLHLATFDHHPYRTDGPERQEYKQLGERGFMDHKREQFWSAARANPWDFADRMADRFLAATLAFNPFDPAERAFSSWMWFNRLTHPLPFMALLVLLMSSRRARLSPVQWAVVSVYLVYLLPYVAISYYDRYAVPLLGVKVLLMVWAVERLLSSGVHGRLPGHGCGRWEHGRDAQDA